MTEPEPEFAIEKHIKYFVSNLRMLPTDYTETETNRHGWGTKMMSARASLCESWY